MTSSISNSISNLNSYTSSSTPTSGSSASSSSSSTASTLSAAGIGSGVNVNQLVSQLMALKQAPINQLNSKNSVLSNQMSAYAQLSGAVSTFQIALGSLTDPKAYGSLTATPSNTSVLNATASSSAAAGSYNISVNNLAHAQTLVAAGQSSATAGIGSGASTTLSFQFGSTSTSGSTTTFTQDPAFGGGSVTIDSNNNSLQGIASAINAAGVGVNATVVNDGGSSPYRLSLTSTKTGAHSTMKITVSGDSALQSLLSQDPEGSKNLTETQAAADASLSVNGLAISSSSNTLSQAIHGVSLNLVGTGTSSLAIAPSTANIATNVQSFVSAYNTLDSTINQLTANANAAAGTSAGPLAGQFPALHIQSQLRQMLGQTMTDPSGKPISLTDIGVTFNTVLKDGSLTLNSSTLNSVIQSNPAKVGAMFAQSKVASDKNLTVSATTAKTTPGSYGVSISQLATQGSLSGKGTMPSSLTVTAGSNDSVSVSVDGVMASIKIPEGTYSQSSFATALEAAINGNSTLTAAGKSVSASVNNNTLSITSGSYGSNSFVSLFGSAIDTAFGGPNNSNFSSGTDVVGTIDGLQARGSGQFLTASEGRATGLSLQVNGGTTGLRGTVTLSSGLANQLNTLSNSFASSTGTISQAMNTLQAQVTQNTNTMNRMNAQLTLEQAALQAQFTALDTTVAQMNNMQTYLTSQFNAMAATQGYVYSSSKSG